MSERADLDAVAEALAALPPHWYGWTDELHDLYERFLEEPELPLSPELRPRFEHRGRRQRLSSATYEAWWRLGRRAEDGGLRSAAERAEAVELAERCVRAGFLAHEAVSFLHRLGRPDGEAALQRLVRDASVLPYDRAWAREWLIRLRHPDYDARAREPVEGEEPLLPQVVRDLPAAAHGGVAWPETESRETVDLLRRVLEALLPAERLDRQEPPADWTYDDEGEEVDYSDRPEWFDVELVRRGLMPHPRLVTRERIAELRSECAWLGLDVNAADFAERQLTRIRALYAGAALERTGRLEYEWNACLTPWAMDLAARYVERDAAAEDAVSMLTYMDDVPYTREVLARLAADASLRPELRSRIEPSH
ncbi:hypothetical protein AB0D99_32755 [Streptomyces sp. NPDC047971]|uniref:hypothetical protein n=1 Tax=Streptomyces sp. NPDC047971 TaxID=3154499 RepID=UPI0033FEF7AD